MTLSIHEQGGLLTSEIDLRIKDAAQEQVTTLEQKLREHQDAIERRLSATDTAVKDNLDRTIELKTDVAVLMASDTRQTELLESISENGNKWHDDDLVYRADMVQRVSAIETEQKKLSDQVNIIRWFVATSSGVTRAIGLGLKILCTESFWKLAGVGALLYGLEKASPWAYKIAKHIIGLQGGQ